MLTVLLPGTGEALTLRQYFGELSDRDRGAYLSGLMDLLRADPQRESEFVRCVHDQGIEKMHAVLTGMVHQDPNILALEVAPWFLYAAARLCPTGEPAMAPTDAPVAPETAMPELPASQEADPADTPVAVVTLASEVPPLAAGVAGIVTGLIAALAAARLARPLRRRFPAPDPEEAP